MALVRRKRKELLNRVKSEYERAYYSGIIAERRAKKRKLRQHTPGLPVSRLTIFCAKQWIGSKKKSRNRSARLVTTMRFCGWNTCARIIERNKLIAREEEETNRTSSRVRL